MSAAAPESAPAAAGEPSEAELERILLEREREEADAVLQIAKTGLTSESPCPVCGDDLEEAPPPGWLKPFVAGGELACDRCKFTATAPPSPFALWAVRPVVTGALLYGSITKIFEAQRISESKEQLLAFALGFGIFGAAAAVWYSVGGAASPKQLQQRILDHRRRHEDEEQGLEAPQTGGGFGEQLEAIVVAVILALIIRHFVMEAFVIPTGSMAPTLLGDHFEVDCQRCGYEFAVGKAEGSLRSSDTTYKRTRCPLCQHVANYDFGRPDVVGGHKILVNKFLYAFRPPERYEVVVFKKPDQPHRNYIKRLVGLPGETLRIVNGDLFTVQDGRAVRARRPDSVQDAIWIPVHDSAFTRNADQPRNPWWQPEGEGSGAWTFGQEGAPDLDGKWMKCAPRDASPAWLAYVPGILTRYAYAGDEGDPGLPTSDLRVRVKVTPEDGATLRLAIREVYRDDRSVRQQRTVTARFPSGGGSGEYAIEVDGQTQATETATALPAGRPSEIALAYADDRARLIVNGTTVLAWEDPYGPEETEDSRVLLASSGAPALFEHTRIDRDIHYVRGSQPSNDRDAQGNRIEYDPSRADVTIPANSYFCMGDHSPNSLDSRSWGFVHEGYMIGRAFMIFWPAQPKHLRLIR